MRVLSVLALICAFCSTAAAQRYTTLFSETIEGKPATASAAEAVIVQKLQAGGVRFIDEAQARKLRSVTDAGRLMEGGVASVITDLDADVIIVGQVQINPLKSALLAGTGSFTASVLVKVITTDTGEVLATLDASAQATHFVPAEAARKAAKDAGAQIAARLLKEVVPKGAGPKAVTLIIEGCPNMMACDRAVDALKGLPGVKKVDTLRAGKSLTKLELLGDKLDARRLARAIDEASALGLSVAGYSKRTVKASYDMGRSVRLALMVGQLKGSGWRSKVYAGVLSTALANASVLQVVPGDPVKLGKNAKAWKKALKKLKISPAAALILMGRQRADKGKVLVEAKLVTGAGADLLAGQKSCPEAEAEGCVASLGAELAAKLPETIQKKRHLFRALKSLPGPGDKTTPLRIESVKVDNVFPSRLAGYANRPLGEITLKNAGEEDLTGVTVRASLGGFGRAAVDQPVGVIKAGKTAKAPLKVVLDKAVLAKHEENTPAVLEIEVIYQVGDFTMRSARKQPLVVYDRNALSWSDPKSVASFASARSVSKPAQAVAKLAQKGELLALAAGMFSALGHAKLRYQRDPANPFGAEALDYVQFPKQTLAVGTGDCDDLAVVYASLLEAVGVRALILVTPSHAFAAVHTGLPPQSRAVLGADASLSFEHAGELWIPVETTLVGKSFEEAWKQGAAVYKGSKVTVVELREAWKEYPPTDLASQTFAWPGALDGTVQAAVGKWKAAREASLAKQLAGPSGPQTLVALGRADEAKAKLAAAKDPKGLNNLGNVLLAKKQVKEARATYGQALKKAKSNPHIHYNAALAALMEGDDDGAGEHIFACLEAGEEGLVEQLAGLGQQAAGSVGAAGGGLASTRLRAVIEKAYKKKGKAPPPKKTGERASQGGSTDLVPYLHWL